MLYEQGTLNLTAKLYTTELSKITDALETLIREPCGCFEQTSSTTYPLVMALLLMKAMPTRDAALQDMIDRSEAKLRTGLERLVSFEAPKGGYEWFGSDPGHEALSAYGLM